MSDEFEYGMSRDERYDLLMSLMEEFSPEETSTRKGAGGKDMTYIGGEHMIARLNDVTVGAWSHRLVGQPFVQMLTVSRWDDSVKGKVPVDMPCMVATVELTIPGLGTHVGMGVQMIEPDAGEDVMKGVITDAMKNAAKYFGVGLYLYGVSKGVYNSGGSVNPDTGEIRQQAPAQRPAPQQGHGTFGPNSRSANDPASAGQINFVRSLIDQLGLTPAEARNMIGVNSADELTKWQASEAITKLQAEQNR
jgi:hypothetical protein